MKKNSIFWLSSFAKVMFVLIFLTITSNANKVNEKFLYSEKLLQTIEETKTNMDVKGDLTLLLLEAKKNWEQLTPDAQERISKILERPEGLENNYIPSSGFFRLWYATDGDDAVDPTDDNENNIPDYVEKMGAVFGEVKVDYTNAGYFLPPTYDGDGYESEYYDVYLSSSEAGDGTYGYVAPEFEIGDNPNSEAVEENSNSSFMVMRSSYEDFGDTEEAQFNAVKATAAHEFTHAVQMGYDAVNMTGFIMEICAVWAEDWIYPGIDDNFQYLPTLFSMPDIALDYRDGEGMDEEEGFAGHWYSSWLFARYMTERYENDIIRKMYVDACSNPELQAMNNVFTTYGTDYFSMVAYFYIANAVLSSKTSNSPYTYSRADDYRNAITSVSFENTIEFTGADVNYDSESDGNSRLMRYGCDYIMITSDKNFSIELNHTNDQDDAAVFLLQMDAVNNPDHLHLVMGENNGSQITVEKQNTGSQYNYYVLAIINLEQSEELNSMQYTFSITESSGTTVQENNPFKKNTMELMPVYPNPFNATTVVSFSLPSEGKIHLSLYDILGKEIDQISDETYPAGTHSLYYRPKNLATGVYFLKLRADNQSKTQKMMYLK